MTKIQKLKEQLRIAKFLIDEIAASELYFDFVFEARECQKKLEKLEKLDKTP